MYGRGRSADLQVKNGKMLPAVVCRPHRKVAKPNRRDGAESKIVTDGVRPRLVIEVDGAAQFWESERNKQMCGWLRQPWDGGGTGRGKGRGFQGWNYW